MAKTMEQEGIFLRHESCPDCESSDALGIFSDGHTFCFKCKKYKKDGEVAPVPARARGERPLVEDGQCTDLKVRGISADTCRKWLYEKAVRNGKTVQVANYMNEHGQIVAQKLRDSNKKFTIVGNAKAMTLYGQWLWEPKGRMVVVTEGEIDALSVSQIQGNRWPVVSLPNGAHSAVNSIKKSIDWLEGFDKVVFMFDNDEAGKEAAAECAPLLSPGKAKVATLPEGMNDANAMLVAGKVKQLNDAIWQAKTYRPDGIIEGSEIWERMITHREEVQSVPWPWACVEEHSKGIRKSEITMITGGSGGGKSTVVEELALHLLDEGETIGIISLETGVEKLGWSLVGKRLNRRLHLEDDFNGKISEEEIKELKSAFQSTIGCGRCYLYDHFGSLDSDNLISRIRFLGKSVDASYIILDHISIVISGMREDNERKAIDVLMTNLRSLAEEINIGIITVVHLKRPDKGKNWDEGRAVSSSDLRGSGSLEQLSDTITAIERNQQDPDTRNEVTVRKLKDRYTGWTGVCGKLLYNEDTGRLKDMEDGDGFFPDDDEKPKPKEEDEPF